MRGGRNRKFDCIIVLISVVFLRNKYKLRLQRGNVLLYWLNTLTSVTICLLYALCLENIIIFLFILFNNFIYPRLVF